MKDFLIFSLSESDLSFLLHCPRFRDLFGLELEKVPCSDIKSLSDLSETAGSVVLSRFIVLCAENAFLKFLEERLNSDLEGVSL